MKNYYELLGVEPSASPQQIKQAFRRQIARYHPDKVQHLGLEFQQLARVRAAELTEAYRVLMDAAKRAEYDRALGAATAETEAPAAGTPVPVDAPIEAPFEAGDAPAGSPHPARAATRRYVRQAALDRFTATVKQVVGEVDALAARGFDVAFVTKLRRGLLRKEEPLGICARFLPEVDADAVRLTWPLAARVGPLDLTLCVFLMSERLADPRELATAVAQLRRRTRIARSLVIVPVDVRDWTALVPVEAPPVIRAILGTLKRGP